MHSFECDLTVGNPFLYRFGKVHKGRCEKQREKSKKRRTILLLKDEPKALKFTG